jgi:tetratricopeptide (TPR) repeat protein
MTDAGRGLAAAHDAGLLHRDIKPENVMIGADGRARVGDFGLARDVDSKEDPPLEGAARILSPMTQTGAVLGTPAYMAPEQLTGETIDARADQFAFCVTMWEALWKERPYQGANFDELVKALETGKRRPPPPTPRVPSKIRAALERGLSTKRDDRFTNMHGLLAALKLPVPRYAIAGGAVVAALAAGGVWFAMRPAPAISCEHAADPYTSQLPRDLPEKLRAVGATAAAQTIEIAINELARDIKSTATTQCKAGRARHDWSPELLAKAEACLEIAVRTQRAYLTYDEVTADEAPSIVRRAKLTRPEYEACTDPNALNARPALPTTATERDAVIQALADANIAYTELGAGRVDRAKPYLDRLEHSPVRDLPIIKAPFTLTRAMAMNASADAKQSSQLASEAYFLARTLDDDETMVPALQLLLYAGIDETLSGPEVQTWVKTAVADAERFAARSPWRAAGLYIALARLADAAGNAEASIGFATKARKLSKPGSEGWIEADLVEGPVLMWSGKLEEGIKMYEGALDARIEQLGPDHPLIGELLIDYAGLLVEARRDADAIPRATRAIEILEHTKSPDLRVLAAARENLASALGYTDRADEAIAIYNELRDNYIKSQGQRSTDVAHVDLNLANTLTTAGKPKQAIPLLEEALEITTALQGPDRIETARVLINLCRAHRDGKDLAKARKFCELSTGIYEKLTPGTDEHRIGIGTEAEVAVLQQDYKRALSLTSKGLAYETPVDDPQSTAYLQMKQAEALIGLHRSADAKPLLEASRKTYESVPLAARVEEIDRLLAKTR